MERIALHRRVFVAAGIYNLLWGGLVGLFPEVFYRWVGIPVPSHPEVAACLGLVIGLYGVVYLEVARVPERGFVLAAVGMAGKVIGPLALAFHLVFGDWPLQALLLIAVNDVVWWVPFALYLRDAWPTFTAEVRVQARDAAVQRRR